MFHQSSASIQSSVVVLQEKLNTIKNIRGTTALTESPFTVIPEYANAVTRLTFGGNLFLATTVVENGFAALDELLGRQNIVGFVRQVFAPISSITDRKERARVLKDFAYLIDSMTQGFLPDFERPFGSKSEGNVLKGLKFAGQQQMRIAKFQLKNITAQRAISVRSFIQDNLTKTNKRGEIPLVELAKLIEKSPIKTEQDFKDRMRQAGISSYANMNIISYMLKSGLLKTEVLGSLIAMLPDKGRYSPFEMSQEIYTTLSPTSNKIEYNQKLDIITGLREVERKYVEEAILVPNAFDITLEKDASSTVGALFEIYRRYPVLFASQRLIRQSSRNGIVRAGMGLISILLLDALYMTALQMANGVKMEEIEEKWREQGLYEFSKLVTRLPVFGRYLGLVTPLANVATRAIEMGEMPSEFSIKKSLTETSSFIPAAALGSMASSGLTGIKALMGDDKLTDQDIINATRIIPYADSAIRMAVYTLGGDSIERRKPKLLGSSSSSSSGGGTDGGGSAMSHYGMSAQIAGTTWEYYTREMLKEVLGNNQAPGVMGHDATQDFQGALQGMVAPPTPTAPAPAPQQPAPSEIATPTSKPENVVDSIINRNAEDAPDSLFRSNS